MQCTLQVSTLLTRKFVCANFEFNRLHFWRLARSPFNRIFFILFFSPLSISFSFHRICSTKGSDQKQHVSNVRRKPQYVKKEQNVLGREYLEDENTSNKWSISISIVMRSEFVCLFCALTNIYWTLFSIWAFRSDACWTKMLRLPHLKIPQKTFWINQIQLSFHFAWNKFLYVFQIEKMMESLVKWDTIQFISQLSSSVHPTGN